MNLVKQLRSSARAFAGTKNPFVKVNNVILLIMETCRDNCNYVIFNGINNPVFFINPAAPAFRKIKPQWFRFANSFKGIFLNRF